MLPTVAATPADNASSSQTEQDIACRSPFGICCRLLSAIARLNRVYGISGRHRASMFRDNSAAPSRKKRRLDDDDYSAGDIDAELFPDMLEHYQMAQQHSAAMRIADSRNASANIVFLNGICATATTAGQHPIALPIFCALHMTAKARRNKDSIAAIRRAIPIDDHKTCTLASRTHATDESALCGCGARCVRCIYMDRVLFQLNLLGVHIDGEHKLDREKLRRMYAIARKRGSETDDGGGNPATELAWLRRSDRHAIAIDILISCELHYDVSELYALRFYSGHACVRVVKPPLPCGRCAAYACALAAHLGIVEDNDRRDDDIAAFHVYTVT
ncbi:hypothetical protein CYMTET_27333 [Cymbomonas tetramitiformis]|uniref:Uncharacterized protein n=1 Tax=Cymbomonas tetramitiformis TaxID=36881 RepID=A0AAE0FQ85_9CHLO|nr:hypothetical protein CYMTET_27333 [Cymbomonas tetramitiformis]